ncbi:sulfotransferase [Mangrovivirga sp. M17]|uniref:Sulfotransferase n=1 Tax=Mangrovivirga halotolerans TaxID=2993936 RepID=A0ABT3RU91_9BACT|nr:sulfotransferase [Mangrovivirga halotolerans]
MAKKTIKHRFFTRFRKNKVISDIFYQTGYDLNPEKWVFIVGCYNSGTTLLTEILSKSSELTVLPDEGVMLTDVLPRPEDFGWRRMWVKCEKDMVVPSNSNRIINRMIRHWSHFVNKSNKIIVEKSISNTARIEFFTRNLDNVHVIHLVRDGYASAEGIRRKAEVMPEIKDEIGDQYDISFAIEQWKRSVNKVNEAKNQIPNFIEITYEGLTADPKSEMNRVTEFLGVSNLSESDFSDTFQVHGKTARISNQNQKSYNRLDLNDWKVINELAEKELKEFGYFKPVKL